ncbi:MAG: hypothetical protein ACYC3I_00560 [Gemmataceae bacterium]
MAAVVNGVLGIGAIGGTSILFVLWFALRFRRNAGGQSGSLGFLLLFLFLGVIFLLGGAGFLLFALLQLNTSIRVHDRGLVWRRLVGKRIVFWEEVDHFSPGDAAAESLTSWSMLLRDGERINFHSVLYHRWEFEKTMELIAEQIEEIHKRLG